VRVPPRLRPLEVLISCEHGGNRIPARYSSLFRGRARLLASHRGYDPGALVMAREFAAALDAELLYSTVSRLLVELNRSLGHRAIFSPPVRELPHAERERIIARYYRPYRDRLEAHVAAAVGRGSRVVHLSCHSFTPRLAGVSREADVGLLFDPARPSEVRLCAAWRAGLLAADATLRVRRNYPYRGTDDGLTPYLRKRFDDRCYAGIELEVSQTQTRTAPRLWRPLRGQLIRSFVAALE
jgi:predicted N-formylglutamate amidohydrolase